MTAAVDLYFRDHGTSAELGRTALRGGIISVVSGYGGTALQFIAAVILARLLTPDDFGLVAIITAVTSFAPFLIDFGMGDATIQRSRITPGQVTSLFWISAGIGFAVAVTLAGCSQFLASIYHDPRLRAITLCSALTFALSGLSGQHLALMRRALQFTAVAWILLLASAVSLLLAVALAFIGAGYWSLVARPIANAALVTAGAWLACRWRPGRPTFDSEVKSMIGFGMHIVGFSVAYSAARATDRLGLGLFYSTREVGYYQNAITLYDSSIFTVLQQLHNVGAAALSKLQSDHAMLGDRYESALSMTAFFMMPGAAILSVTAQDLVSLVLGAKWQPAGALLAILALRGISQSIEGSQGWLHLSLGRADRWKNWGLVTAVVQVVAVACGLPFGPAGVAIAIVVANALLAVPSISYAGRPAGIGAKLVMRAIGPQLVGTLACIAAGWIVQEVAFRHFGAAPRIATTAILCSAVYLFVVVGLFRLRKPLEVIMRLMGQQLPPRAATWISARLRRA